MRELVGFQAADCELRLVVEHLLEVRNPPLCVDGIPVKPSADMIMDAALGHFADRRERHVERGGISASVIPPEKKIESHWPREFRPRAEAPMHRIIAGRNLFESIAECGVFD